MVESLQRRKMPFSLSQAQLLADFDSAAGCVLGQVWPVKTTCSVSDRLEYSELISGEG